MRYCMNSLALDLDADVQRPSPEWRRPPEMLRSGRRPAHRARRASSACDGERQATTLTIRPGTTITFLASAPADRASEPWRRRGRRPRPLRIGVGGDGDVAAHLAVDLHRVLDRVVDEQRRIGGRHRLVGDRRRCGRGGRHSSSPTCGTSGDAISTSASATSRGVAVELGDVVVELDQLGDRRVEAQRLHVGAHGVDRAVQQLAWSRRRPGTSTTRTSPVCSSTMLRHSRCRKRNMPTTSRVSHGRDASSGPVAIRCRRSVSAP